MTSDLKGSTAAFEFHKPNCRTVSHVRFSCSDCLEVLNGIWLRLKTPSKLSGSGTVRILSRKKKNLGDIQDFKSNPNVPPKCSWILIRSHLSNPNPPLTDGEAPQPKGPEPSLWPQNSWEIQSRWQVFQWIRTWDEQSYELRLMFYNKTMVTLQYSFHEQQSIYVYNEVQDCTHSAILN